MAKYNREFLVPYLHDLCALYFVDRKLERIKEKKQALLRRYRTKERILKPVEPRMKDDAIGCLGIGGVVFAIMGIMMFYIMITDPSGIG